MELQVVCLGCLDQIILPYTSKSKGKKGRLPALLRILDLLCNFQQS